MEYDIIPDKPADFSQYDLLILPCLYSAPEELLNAVRYFVEQGGHLIGTFKTAFADQYLKIYHAAQPHVLDECFGLHYDRFTKPKNVFLAADGLPENAVVSDWMELLEPTTARAVAQYQHPVWGGIPAVTENAFGKGSAVYLGCYFDSAALDALLRQLLPGFGIKLPDVSYPIVMKSGTNQFGKQIRYCLNFSDQPQRIDIADTSAQPLLGGTVENGIVQLEPWGVQILES